MMKRFVVSVFCITILYGFFAFSSYDIHHSIYEQLIQYELKLLDVRTQTVNWHIGEWTVYDLKVDT